MNKDFLVVLLEKDIKELELLTQGFEHLEHFPKPIILLAKQKAESIVKNLEELEKLDLLKVETITNHESEIESAEKVMVVDETNIGTDLKVTHAINNDLLEMLEEEDVDSEDVDFKEDIADYAIQTNNADETKITEEITPPSPTMEDQEVIVEKPAPSVTIVHNEDTTEVATVSNSLNENIRINDIRLAINIGDRFRFQRELFGGNGEVMNKTIAYLNQLNKYDEAVSFLNNKFGWAKDNQHAEDFLQLIRRRYL